MLIEGLDEGQMQSKIDDLRVMQRNNVDRIVTDVLLKILKELKEMDEQRKTTYEYSLVKAADAIKKGSTYYNGINMANQDLLIIDEFQDTNPAQLKMLEALMSRNEKMRILSLGDFDQNIYTFRGSSIVKIDQFCQNHRAEVTKLPDSHRLSPPVSRLSEILINSIPQYRHLRERYYADFIINPLNMDQVHEPQVRKFDSEFSEVRWVIDKLYELIKVKKVRPGDITILLRSFKGSYFYDKFKIELKRRA